MFHVFSFTCMIIYLFCIQFACSIPPWIPAEVPSRFSSVTIPVNYTTKYEAEYQQSDDYTFLIFADDSPFHELCTFNAARNCSDELLLDELLYQMNNAENRSNAVLMFNRCLYCGAHTEIFEGFLDTLQHSCQFPILYQELWRPNLILTREKLLNKSFASQLTMCYCGAGSGWKGQLALFGYRCDQYTRLWIPLAYRYIPLAIIVILSLLLAFALILLFFPRIIERIRSMLTLSDIVKLLDLRVQTLSYLNSSIIFLILEQIVIIANAYLFGMKNFQDRIWIPGFARKVSLLLLGSCYATTLIQWISLLVDNTQTSAKISRKLKIILWTVYALLILLLVGNLILNFAFHVPMWITHLIFAICSGLYLIVFPLSFTIAGIKMFLALRRVSVDTNLLRLKFMWFVIATNIIFTIGFVDGILIILTYINGWDFFGPWFGLFDTTILDFISIMIFILLSYILFNRNLFCNFQFYVRGNLEETKKLIEENFEESTETKYPTIDPRNF
jgi:hypothetical protein